MNVIGLDLSWTSIGLADANGVAHTIGTNSHAYPNDMARATSIVDQIFDYIVTTDHETVDLVAVEGFSHGSGFQAHRMGGLNYVVQMELYREKIPVVMIPPASVKKYASGNGNAAKSLMLVEAVKRLGYEGSSDDEADALWLRQMALARYAPEMAVEVPKSHLSKMDNVSWPMLDVVVLPPAPPLPKEAA